MANAFFEKYKSPVWQKKRLEALEAADWKCEVCLATNCTLHVHHKKYFKGRDPWEYENNQLAVLCENCHSDIHKRSDLLGLACSRLPVDGMKWIDQEKAAHLLAGAMGLENWPAETAEEKAWFYAGLAVQDLVDENFQRLLKKEGAQ